MNITTTSMSGPPDGAVPVPCAPRFPDCHDPFWPRIELSVLRERLALDAQVSDARLGLAVRCAAIAAAREFATWRAALRGRGYQRLEDLASHRQGRALSLCYSRYLEAAAMKALAHTSEQRKAEKGEHYG
ncbi:head completion/stabilization protein [Pseudomonas putida]